MTISASRTCWLVPGWSTSNHAALERSQPATETSGVFDRAVGLSGYREDGAQHIAAYVLAEIPSIFICETEVGPRKHSTLNTFPRCFVKVAESASLSGQQGAGRSERCVTAECALQYDLSAPAGT